MTVYVRNLTIKKPFLMVTSRIYFEYFLGDIWRKGSAEFRPTREDTSLSYTSSVISEYIQEKIRSGKLPFTKEELVKNLTVVNYFNQKMFDIEYSKIKIQ